MAAKMEPKFSPPSMGGISGLKVIFFFPLLPLEAIVGGVVDFFLCKRGGEAGKEGFSANEKTAWRKIWCGFFFQCGYNGHGAFSGIQWNDRENLTLTTIDRFKKEELA